MNKDKKRKTLANEKLPDPKAAFTELSKGKPRARTADHLRRILATSLSLPLAVGVSGCRGLPYMVVDPVPPPATVPYASATLKAKSLTAVSINGSALEPWIPNSVRGLLGGTHTIQTSSLSNAEDTVTLEIAIELGYSLNRDQAIPYGTLKPESAFNIRVDGEPVRRAAPENSIELSAGTHTIEFSSPPPSGTYTFVLGIQMRATEPQGAVSKPASKE